MTRKGETRLTTLKRELEATRQRERQFRDIVEQSTDMLSRHAPDGTYRYVSPSCEELLGYRPGELVGRSAYDFFHPEDLAAVEKSHSTVLDVPDVYTVAYRIRRGDGSYTWFETTSHTLRDAGTGEVAEIICVSRDISVRKAEEEHRHRRVVDNVPDIIYRYQVWPERRFEYLNPAVSGVLGYAPEEIYEDPALERRIVHPDHQEVLSTFDPAREGQLTELKLVHRDGYVVWGEHRRVPVRDPNGRIVAFEGVVRDVSQRRQLEEQLRAAQKLEAVGQLTSGIAHDFNNILSVIIANAELARGDTGMEAVRDEVDDLLTAARNGAALIKKLMGFSRHADLSIGPVSLADVVEETIDLLRRILPANIEVHAADPPSRPRVLADPDAVQQILLNLATNARDAMPGGGRLSIETCESELDESYVDTHPWLRPGRFACVRVSDTGTGMDAATQAKIFEPFFTTKEKGKGTGLGMAMIYGLMKQHDGAVHVYSELGSGTTISVYFPVTEEAARRRISRETGPLPEGTETILLVEDDEGLRRTAERVLSRLGYQVVCARDGVEALAVADRHAGEIGLVLSDVMMPRLTGRELVQALRERDPNVKVLLASGYVAEEIRQQLAMEGDVPFIQKPWTVQELAVRVREVLDEGG